MRINFLLPVVFAALLGACGDAGASCGTGDRNDEPTPGIVASGVLARTPSHAAPLRVVPVKLDSTASLYERAKIARALNERNHVQNGALRLEVKEALSLDGPDRCGGDHAHRP